jgi:hypothetical protein
MQPRKSKAFEAYAKLRKRHRKDSKEQLFARWLKLVESDESLKEAMIDDVFRMMTDELYDEAVREGRSIPPALRRPS